MAEAERVHRRQGGLVRKYSETKHEFSKYVDMSLYDLRQLIKEESTELERSDLKAIILELCTRLVEAG